MPPTPRFLGFCNMTPSSGILPDYGYTFHYDRLDNREVNDISFLLLFA